MLPGHEPFLAAITAAPDDDLPRLVFADWLEENGDPDRAEFIRLQIERWRTKEEQRYPRPMKARIAELRAEHGERWRADLPPLPGVAWGRWWRGFVSEARFATPAALIEHAAAVFAASPVRVVQVSGLGPEAADAVFRLPQLGDLYGLRLDAVSPDLALWQGLTACSWFARLYHLIAYPTRGRTGQEEEIVRLVIAVANREGSRLRKAHMAMHGADNDTFSKADRGKLWLTGLPEFWPL